jgi:uncharacterized membrane protein YfcA
MNTRTLIHRVWTVLLMGLGGLLVFLALTPRFSMAHHLSGTPWLFAIVLGSAFIAEYVDSSLGMGYGTTLTPVLLLFGFTPLQIVPAVLLSEFISGVSAGGLHHRLGNVDFGRGTRARKSALILALCSVGGTVGAVLIAVTLPRSYVKIYIGAMIFLIGLYIVLARRSGGFRWSKIIGLGTVAAFNKGISGGGYGPLVTGGQVIAGVDEKSAVGITSLAEGLVCAVGLAFYLAMGQAIAWSLAVPLVLGALLSVPAATLTVKVMPANMLRRSIGVATLLLGTLTLIQVVL